MYSTNTAYSAVPLAERSFQWGYGGCRGPKGRNRNLPWPPAKKVIRKLLSLLFISTPQSIAKPSPGWNKVALLTAVRNSPCSCPFSVSLHPPQAALNSEPRKRWRLIVRFISLHIKPALKGEVAMSVSELTEGLKKKVASLGIVNPSVSLRSTAPRSGRLLVRYKHGVQCRTPSRSDRFNGVTGVARGPKGRNRNLPWPPGKKVYSPARGSSSLGPLPR